MRSGDRHVRFDGPGSSVIQAPPPPRAPHPAAPTCPGHATVLRQALASLGGLTPGREHGEKGAEEATRWGCDPAHPRYHPGQRWACVRNPTTPSYCEACHSAHSSKPPQSQLFHRGVHDGQPQVWAPAQSLPLVRAEWALTDAFSNKLASRSRLRRGPVLLHILSSVRKGDGRSRKRWSERFCVIVSSLLGEVCKQQVDDLC